MGHRLEFFRVFIIDPRIMGDEFITFEVHPLAYQRTYKEDEVHVVY